MPNNINLLLIDVSILITLNLTNNPEMVAAKCKRQWRKWFQYSQFSLSKLFNLNRKGNFNTYCCNWNYLFLNDVIILWLHHATTDIVSASNRENTSSHCVNPAYWSCPLVPLSYKDFWSENEWLLDMCTYLCFFDWDKFVKQKGKLLL